MVSRIIKFCFFSLVMISPSFNVFSQSSLPNSSNQVGNAVGVNSSVNPAITYSNTFSNNYIRIWEPRQPYNNETSVVSTARLISEVNQTSQYLDGLGRPIQTVNKGANPNLTDIVTLVVYDIYGKESYKYLPYNSTANDGALKLNPFNDQLSFYSSTYVNQQKALTNEQYYYGKTIYENSPLGRIQKSFAPGNSWVGSEGSTTNEHALSSQYLISNSNDLVRVWTITNNILTYLNNDQATNIPSSTGGNAVYDAGQLYKTVTVDEQNHAVVEYKDKNGQVVLKKVQIGISINSDFSGQDANWLCTYYVYDDFGLLRFVMPPKATSVISGQSWVLDASTINELCFRYEYDSRNRMIAKKVPGAGWVYMIYDQRDRLVFTQDANMGSNANQWLYTMYEMHNRPVQTGMMIGYLGSPSDLQTWVTNNTGNSVSSTVTTNSTISASIPIDISYTSRDAAISDYQASNTITLNDGFVTEDNAASILFEIVAANGGSVQNSVVVLDKPIPTGPTTIALTQTFYDDYTQASTSKAFNNANNSKLDAGNNVYAETLPSSASLLTKGTVTSSKVRVIEDPSNLTLGNWLETVNYFDDKGRVAQTISDNYKGGLETSTSRYDFTNKPISTYQTHTNPAAQSTVSLKTNIDYDHSERVLAIRKTINDDVTTTRTIVQNSYDALGQILTSQIGQKKNIDGSLSTSPLHQSNYAYNIRGWLKGINWNNYGAASGATSAGTDITNNKWFAFDLNYDWGFGTNQFNGNISGQRWQSGGDGNERAFGYGYDNANRILFADFNQNFAGTWAKTIGSFGIDFSVKMGDGLTASSAYDANGNILAMTQKGLLLNASSTIDNLAYAYQSNSNKLQNVIDGANNPTTALGDFRTSANSPNISNLLNSRVDYTYDLNGNLQKDLNKDMGTAAANGIVYNHLNLPYQITVQSKGVITYIYDAAGNKLEKRTLDNTISKTTYTDYLTGFVYTDNTLQFFAQEQGRVRAKQAAVAGQQPSFSYDYFIKDHLGNTRVVLTDELQTDTYPAATLEDGATATENTYYAINTGDIVANPATLPSTYQNNNGNPPYNTNPTSNTTATSAKMYKLNGASGDKTGLGITLKVMAGDVVNIFGKSYWTGTSPTNTYTTVVNNLLTALASTSAIATAGKGATAAALTGSAVRPTDVSNFLSTAPLVTGRPKAYINWILFDEQFRTVSSNCGFSAVNSASGVLNTHTQGVNISKNGYLYVYCSNESNLDVFFDNLQLIHTRGPLLEETHYYPFGLTMAGISSKAAGKLENKKNKFQRQEYNDDLGADIYEFKWRMHDPQMGRFWQVDPLAEKYVYNSTYAFSENKVTGHVELEGLEAFEVKDGGFVNGPYRNQAAAQAAVDAGKAKSQPHELPEVVVKSSAKRSSNLSDGGSIVGNDIVGSTVTTKQTTFEKDVINSGFGDKVTVSGYTGLVTGKDGMYITTDASSQNGVAEGQTLTVGFNTFAYSAPDLSISGGISAFGVEVHGTIGAGGGRPFVGAGASYTSKNKVVNGGDFKAQPGLVTVAVVAAILSQQYYVIPALVK
jgi:RHS repeat-associated protein